MEASEWFKQKNKDTDFNQWFDYTYDHFPSFRRFPKSVLEDMARLSWKRCTQLHNNAFKSQRNTIKDAIDAVDDEDLKGRLKKILSSMKNG